MRIISKFYCKTILLQNKKYFRNQKDRYALLGLSNPPKKFRFKILGVKMNFKTLAVEVQIT
jgi:hypothetical protein